MLSRFKKSVFPILILSALILFNVASCTKSADSYTYELTLKADIATTGKTTFGEIKYNDGTSVQSILNSTTSFSKTFQITAGTPIYFGVVGGVTGASSTSVPVFNISYELNRISGNSRDIVCSSSTGIATYKNNVWSFNFLADAIFNGVSCQ